MGYELLVSTRKGLVVGRSEDRRRWEWGATQFGGWQVDYAVRDPGSERIWAAVSHLQWGPHLHFSDDGGESWEEGMAPAFTGETYPVREWDEAAGDFGAPREAVASLGRVWTIHPAPSEASGGDGLLYAGVDPAALFVSRDGGASWELCEGLWNHPTRPQWLPGAAGMTLHHITFAGDDPGHLWVGMSSVGVFESRDGGGTWVARNRGLVAEHLADTEQEAGQCVHSLHAHPLQAGRLFQQHHPGVYRSDDGGESWVSIARGLPGEFGFASTIDPGDADAFYVVPLEFDQARVPVGGDLKVFRTRDAGETWEGLSAGLPGGHVLQGVYRQALCNDGGGAEGLGLYLGTSGGHVYASRDGGDEWEQLLDHLAPITAIRASSTASSTL